MRRALAAVSLGALLWFFPSPPASTQGTDARSPVPDPEQTALTATGKEQLRAIDALPELDPETSVPTLARLLAAPTREIRQRAASALAKIGLDALPVLTAMLDDADPAVGSAGLAGLRWMGEPGLRVMLELAKQEDDPRLWDAAGAISAAAPKVDPAAGYAQAIGGEVKRIEDKRYIAFDAFEEPARSSLLALIQGIEEEDEARRISHIVALRAAGPAAKDALPSLTAMLQDPSPVVRWAAAGTLAAVGRPALPAVPALARALASDCPLVRREAADALGRIRPAAPEAVAALTQALSDSSWHVRVTAAQALGRGGRAAVEGIDGLCSLLDDEQPEVRSAAAATLGKTGLKAAPAVPLLVKCLQDPSSRVRASAAAALEAIGPPDDALPALLDNLGLGLGASRRAVLSFPPEQTLGALMAALESDDSATRTDAARVLQALGPRAAPALPALVEALRGEAAGVREVAEAIVAIGPATRPHVPQLLAILQESEAPRQRLIVQVLSELGATAEEAVPALLRVDPRIVSESIYGPGAAAASVASASDVAMASLVESAQSPDPVLSGRALNALGYLQRCPPEALRLLLQHPGAGGSPIGPMFWDQTLGVKAALAELVSDPDPAIRKSAVMHLPRGFTDPAVVVPALITAVSDPQPDIRATAADGLCALADGATPAIQVLEAAASDPDETARTAVRRALYAVRAAAEPNDPDREMQQEIAQQIHLLGNPDLGTRQVAARALGRIGAAAVASLTDALRDPDMNRRYHAAEALGYMKAGAAPALPALLEAMRDPEGKVRRAGAGAVAAVGVGAEELPILLEALDDDDMRHGAVDALAGLGAAAEPAVPRLVEIMCADPAWTTRRQAMETLGALGGLAEAAVPYLREALSDPEDDIRQQVMQTLLQLHPGDLSPAETLLLDAYRYTRCDALRCLRDLGPGARAALPAVRDALLDADPWVRVSAGWALYAIAGEPDAAIPVISRELRSPNEVVRQSALRALQEIGPGAWDAVPALRPLLADPIPRVRVACVRALWAITGDADELVPVLIADLRGRDAMTRQSAAKILWGLGPAAKAAIPELEAARFDRNNHVYRAAQEAVQAIATEG